jgi:hypothetical protein
LDNDLKRLDIGPLFSCASLRLLSVPETTKLVSHVAAKTGLLNPPALNDIMAQGRIKFVIE